jgi:CspA family cold shock protein
MPSGVIKKFLDERGFGFIKPDDGGPDLFFHIKEVVPSGIIPEEHEACEYELATDPRTGRPQALNVRLIA